MEGGCLIYARLLSISHISSKLDVTDKRMTDVTFLMMSEMQLYSFVT